MARDGGTLVIQNLPGIGDALWFLKAVKAIARSTSEGKITLLTRKRTCADQLFSREPWLKDILWIEDFRHNGRRRWIRDEIVLAKALRKYRFSSAWTLRGSPELCLICALADIPKIFGPGRGKIIWPFLGESPIFPRSWRRTFHDTVLIEKVLRAHDIFPDDRDYVLIPDAESVSEMAQRFSFCKRPWISLGFGCSSRSRKWHPDHFIELATKLSHAGQNTIFLCGAPHEAHEAMALQHAIRAGGGKAIPILNALLSDTIALMSLMDASIGNDSALFHIAAALGVPSLGIFRGAGPRFHTSRIMQDTIYSKKRGSVGGEFPKDEISAADVMDVFLERMRCKT